MSSISGTKFGPGYLDRRRKRQHSRGWVWVLSLAVHGLVLMGMGIGWHLVGDSMVAGRGESGEAAVLEGGWSTRQTNTGPSVVSFNVPAVNRAPDLLAPMRQPMFDANVMPAGAMMPIENRPRTNNPHPNPLPKREGMTASRATVARNGQELAGPNSGETQVFGLRSRGARFVYVFDRSASMEGGLLSAAKREMIASLQELDGRHQFQIIFYNDRPSLMPAVHGTVPRMAFADEPGKRLAASFVGGVFADGGTSHLQALELALSLKPDVIFFLTDAEEPQMRAEELAMVRRMNRGTRINAIEFGAGPQKAVINFLQVLAAENSGQHAYVDVRLLRSSVSR
jgi:hypothetical protein